VKNSNNRLPKIKKKTVFYWISTASQISNEARHMRRTRISAANKISTFDVPSSLQFLASKTIGRDDNKMKNWNHNCIFTSTVSLCKLSCNTCSINYPNNLCTRIKRKGRGAEGLSFDVLRADNIDASSRIETPAEQVELRLASVRMWRRVVVVVIVDADADYDAYSSTRVTHRRQPDEPACQPSKACLPISLSSFGR